MGMFIRKSVSVGPVRVNLSKSGVGVSVGVTGARVGLRPDGKAYVHAGRGGVYYRKLFTAIPDDTSESQMVNLIRQILDANRDQWFESYCMAFKDDKVPQSQREIEAGKIGALLDKLSAKLVNSGYPVYDDPKLLSIASMVENDYMLNCAFPAECKSWNDDLGNILERAIDIAIQIIKENRHELRDLPNMDDAERVDLLSYFVESLIVPVLNKELDIENNKVLEMRLLAAISHELHYGADNG